MDKTGRGFKYVRNKFPNVSDAKIKEGTFIGPQIRELMWDSSMKTWMRLQEMHDCQLRRQGPLRKSQSSELSGCCAGPVDSVQSDGMLYENENPFSGVTLGFFPRKSQQSQWWTRWKFSPRHYGYGKAVPRQVGIKYVSRLLLDTEEGCTWCQILAKVIRFYILEEVSVSWAHKYYFVHLNSSIFETLPDRKILYTFLNSA